MTPPNPISKSIAQIVSLRNKGHDDCQYLHLTSADGTNWSDRKSRVHDFACDLCRPNSKDKIVLNTAWSNTEGCSTLKMHGHFGFGMFGIEANWRMLNTGCLNGSESLKHGQKRKENTAWWKLKGKRLLHGVFIHRHLTSMARLAPCIRCPSAASQKILTKILTTTV
jgi:hypothetical protein